MRQLDGSGEITISPDAVEINQTSDYRVTYKAATKLTDVWLVVDLPADAFVRPVPTADDPDAIAAVTTFTETRVDLVTNALSYGYIPPDADNQELIASDAAVRWKIASLNAGSTFTKTIRRLRAKGDAGKVEWSVVLVGGDTAPEDASATAAQIPATLYILQAGSNPDIPDVTFGIQGGDAFDAASSPDTIIFRFTAAETPIKDGNVSFRTPIGLDTAPNKTADKPGTVNGHDPLR